MFKQKDYFNLYFPDLFYFKQEKGKFYYTKNDFEELGTFKIKVTHDTRKGIDLNEIKDIVEYELEKELNKITIDLLKNNENYLRYKKPRKCKNNFKFIKIQDYGIIREFPNLIGLEVPKDLKYYLKFSDKIEVLGFEVIVKIKIFKNKG